MRILSIRIAMLAFAIFLTLAPSGVWAYSYGSADTEDMAETFKLVVSSLEQSPPDWDGALAAHKARRSEISSHFGEPVAVTLDNNFKSRKAPETIANYKAMLLMNLDRRFENTLESISDYAKAKLLLAKAKATFDTLSPYVEAQLPSTEMERLKKDFNTALDAIGNPGLFGVGKKEADEKVLKATVNQIYSKIKPFFPFAASSGTDQGSEPSGDKGTNQAEPNTIEGTKQHAPMTHENKTNSVVTLSVIGGIVIVGGAAVWWARRKGFF
ncbi:hypothetical protein Back11_52030 [Paenibacillus baekrokdamisoli]|uniref:Uncharacterized protein n=1 Tax=Paenibacillus baekrokdamisoli TaxID=1712516 RepID=A0A3G9JIE2_9BACL|nr:hypothetical protein [Paenibacillus baekrokdamisoli]MBB3069040.1 hypothetical protein [Paenibacillus baekrokdamisoli]BBH23858.1 hypothetical protein Back11_52030 [Paenibacillus baekrokdamisoli]